jgi:hypothetical protein
MCVCIDSTFAHGVTLQQHWAGKLAFLVREDWLSSRLCITGQTLARSVALRAAGAGDAAAAGAGAVFVGGAAGLRGVWRGRDATNRRLDGTAGLFLAVSLVISMLVWRVEGSCGGVWRLEAQGCHPRKLDGTAGVHLL